jgi:hypothetical protein
MIKILRSVINQLYYPLQSQGNWQSLFIDYEKPFVERIWTKMNVDGHEYRVYLHKIHPCSVEEALYHPHPWPSAMLLCGGNYETGIGFGDGDTPPPKMGPFYLREWSAYEMTNPKEWHYVRPIDAPCLTIMVTGSLYEDVAKKPKQNLRPLTKDEFTPIFEVFQKSENRVKMLEVLDYWIGK